MFIQTTLPNFNPLLQNPNVPNAPGAITPNSTPGQIDYTMLMIESVAIAILAGYVLTNG